MADTRTWDAGGSDGVWNTVANWTDDTKPITGDDILFNALADVAVTTPGSPGITPALLFIGGDYTKDIGDSVSNQLDMTATKLVHRGKGTLWYKHAQAVDELIVNHTGQSRTLALDITNSGTSGAQTLLTVSRGRVTATSDTSETTRDLIAVSGRESELTLSNTAPLVVTFMGVAGGKLTLNITNLLVADLFVLAGTLTIEGVSTVARLHIAGGGLATVNGTGLVSTANIMDGVLDYTQTQIKRTITTVNLWPNGKFKYFPDLTTLTNPIYEFDGRSVAP